MRYCSPIRLSATWDIQKKMLYMAPYHFQRKFNFEAFLASIVLLKNDALRTYEQYGGFKETWYYGMMAL
jgi:hypothetical protein